MTEYNPRYLEYCKAHGKTFDNMLKADRIKYPGGCMCGFILWMSEKWYNFDTRHPEFKPYVRTKEEQSVFDEELKAGRI